MMIHPVSRQFQKGDTRIYDSSTAPHKHDFVCYCGKCFQGFQTCYFDAKIVPYLIDYTTTFAIVNNADCTKTYLDMSERF